MKKIFCVAIALFLSVSLSGSIVLGATDEKITPKSTANVSKAEDIPETIIALAPVPDFSSELADAKRELSVIRENLDSANKSTADAVRENQELHRTIREMQQTSNAQAKIIREFRDFQKSYARMESAYIRTVKNLETTPKITLKPIYLIPAETERDRATLEKDTLAIKKSLDFVSAWYYYETGTTFAVLEPEIRYDTWTIQEYQNYMPVGQYETVKMLAKRVTPAGSATYNVIFFGDFLAPPSEFGEAEYWGTAFISYQAVVEMRDKNRATLNGSYMSYYGLIAHELGHLIAGLDHPNSDSTIMNPLGVGTANWVNFPEVGFTLAEKERVRSFLR